MRPIIDRIIVRRNEVVQKGDIVTPDQYLEKPVEGTVVSVPVSIIIGHHILAGDAFCKVGDVVRFGDANAEPFKDDDGNELLIVRIQDVRYVR